MNKIEEILQGKEMYDPEYPTISISDAIEAMKEFGKLCFNAGSKFTWKSTGDYSGYESYKYKTFEDFLKEIENEKE